MARWLAAVLVVPLVVTTILAVIVVRAQNERYYEALELAKVASLAEQINYLDRALGEEALAGQRAIAEPDLWVGFEANRAATTDRRLAELESAVPPGGDPTLEKAILATERLLEFRSDIPIGLVSPLQLADRYSTPRTQLLDALRVRGRQAALERLIDLIEARSAHLDERFSSELALTYGTWAPGQHTTAVAALAIQEDRIASTIATAPGGEAIGSTRLAEYREVIQSTDLLPEISSAEYAEASDQWLALLNAEIDEEARSLTIALEGRASAARQARWLTIAGVAFGVLLAFMTAGLISYRIVGRVGIIAEFAQRFASGERASAPLSTVVTGHDELAGLAVTFDEMAGEVRKRDHRLAAQSRVDDLTKILNRRAVIARWSQLLEREDGRAFAFAIDLDGFKPINDRYGHHAGDSVLVEVADRLRKTLDPHRAVVGRTGGDEFLAIFDHPNEASEDLMAIAETLRSSLRAPIEVDDVLVSVEAAIGIVRSRNDGSSAAELLRDADAALYVAKSGEHGRVVESDEQLRDHLAGVEELRTAVRRALDDDEFEPWFQPIWQADGQLAGFEALARWCPPGEDVRGTGSFIDAIADQHLLHRLDAQILRRTCQTIARWTEASSAPLIVSANISTDFLEQHDFVSTVETAMEEANISPLSLILEVSESGLMTDAASNADRCQELRDIGIKIAVDDYGIGYSSLSYLRQLPVDFVKLDRQFVTDIDTDRKNQAIARSVISLTSDLGMRTIIEGVEREQELDWLVDSGADFLQGYLLGRPIDLNEAWELFDMQTKIDRSA